MSITSKVRQSVVLVADGQVQKLINGTATDIGKANILNIFAQATDADAEIKLYNEPDNSKTAASPKIKIRIFSDLIIQPINSLVKSLSRPLKI